MPKLLCTHLQRRDDVISQCTQSVRCDHNMHRMDDAVVDIYAINLQLGAMAVCTGDTFPFTPYRCACMLDLAWLSLAYLHSQYELMLVLHALFESSSDKHVSKPL